VGSLEKVWTTLCGLLGTLTRRITESYYNKKREEFRTKQKEISNKISKLSIADEKYYLTCEYLLQLASGAYDPFMSSEVEEKRQLLKLILQNLKLEDEKVEFELVKPFGKVSCLLKSSKLAGGRNSSLVWSCMKSLRLKLEEI
jgi:hypothetical protein